jgi:NADPH:quinone reductase-like Zn-dependent oxidoreductase
MTSASIPKTMKGVQMKHFGGSEVLQYKTDLPVAVPRDGEVLVKNEFIGINYVDVFVALLPSQINSSIRALTLLSDIGALE